MEDNKYYRIKFNKNINIRAYVDTDLDDDNVTRIYTTGFVIFMGSAPVT